MSADERLVAVSHWRCATCGHEERDLRSMMKHTMEAHPEPRRVLVEMFPKRPRAEAAAEMRQLFDEIERVVVEKEAKQP